MKANDYYFSQPDPSDQSYGPCPCISAITAACNSWARSAELSEWLAEERSTGDDDDGRALEAPEVSMRAWDCRGGTRDLGATRNAEP